MRVITFILLLFTGCSTASRRPPELVQMEPRISVITLGVSDLLHSYGFYKFGLGFPTKMTPNGGIILFDVSTGTHLMLYPRENLAADSGFPNPKDAAAGGKFPGFTLGHCVRSKEEVDAVLAQAQQAGATLCKPPVQTAWGGYAGYFQDPDGYCWEVLYSDKLKFRPDGSVIIP